MAKKHPGGRPTKMTKDVIAKLEAAFKLGFTDEMACLDADISETTFYRFCEANPQFRERKEKLKISPNLAAQRRLAEDTTTTAGARFWAEKKMPDFMPKAKVEHGGRIETVDSTATEAARELKEEYEAKLREAIVKGRAKKEPVTNP